MQAPRRVCLCAALLAAAPAAGPAWAESVAPWEQVATTTHPLAPDYRFGPDGAVTLRVCYNWACASAERLTFSAEEMAHVMAQVGVCGDTTFAQRLQRLRLGIWQMELLAAKHQPLLANDLGTNRRDAGVAGRTDCIDNTSNTTNFLHVLVDAGALAGWSVTAPRVRDRFLPGRVHWTAVAVDAASGTAWSVDSWYRPHGHLPFVMPLAAWLADARGWQPPQLAFNPTPPTSRELCPAGGRAAAAFRARAAGPAAASR